MKWRRNLIRYRIIYSRRNLINYARDFAKCAYNLLGKIRQNDIVVFVPIQLSIVGVLARVPDVNVVAGKCPVRQLAASDRQTGRWLSTLAITGQWK